MYRTEQGLLIRSICLYWRKIWVRSICCGQDPDTDRWCISTYR